MTVEVVKREAAHAPVHEVFAAGTNAPAAADPWSLDAAALRERLSPWFDGSMAISAANAEKLEARLYDVDSHRATVDDAIKTVREILIVFLVASAYLAITVLATTDKQLLIGGASLKLPIVGADLNIVGFYLIAPWLVAVLHLNLLLKLALLSRKLAVFNAAVVHADNRLSSPSVRLGEIERTRLASFPLAHVLAGARPNRSLTALLHVFVWIILLCWPLAVLFMALVRFLPYHDEFYTWLQRGAIVFDLAVVWLLWPQIVNFEPGRGIAARIRAFARTPGKLARFICRAMSEARATLQRPIGSELVKAWKRSWAPPAPASTRHRISIANYPARRATASKGRKGTTALWLATAPVGLLLWTATIPGEALDSAKLSVSAGTRSLRDIQVQFAPAIGLLMDDEEVARLFPASDPKRCAAGGCDWLTFWFFGAQWSLVSRNLVVRDERLHKEEVKPEDIFELERAPYEGAGLAKFSPLDLRGRDLRFADLRGSKLVKVRLGPDDRGRPARLFGAKLAGATLIRMVATKADFRNADLRAALIQNADLSQVDLRNADLRYARLQHATLTRAGLQGADMSAAQLVGANISNGQLQGARLFAANLHGAELADADLRGAVLTEARLQGAHLDRARFEAANLRFARLEGADLRNAVLDGAELVGAQLHSVRSLGARWRYADLRQAFGAGRALTHETIKEIVDEARRNGLVGKKLVALQENLSERAYRRDDLDRAPLHLAYCSNEASVPSSCNVAWASEPVFLDEQIRSVVSPLLCSSRTDVEALRRFASDALTESNFSQFLQVLELRRLAAEFGTEAPPLNTVRFGFGWRRSAADHRAARIWEAMQLGVCSQAKSAISSMLDAWFRRTGRVMQLAKRWPQPILPDGPPY